MKTLETRSPRLATLRVLVHGADGARGAALAELLRSHPVVTAGSEVSECGELLVSWEGAGSDSLRDARGRLLDTDVVFVCLPPGDAAQVAWQARDAGSRVVDLSGARGATGLALARDASSGASAYGLPELGAAHLDAADYVANADSVAACATILLAPLAMAGLVERRVRLEAVVGLTDGGARQRPRRPLVEREIQVNLRELHRCPYEPRVALKQVVEPQLSGVRVGTWLQADRADARRCLSLYQEFYRDQPWVEVLPEGLPVLPALAGTDVGQVTARDVGGAVEVTCAVNDSLRGSATRALRCMNLMFGLPETLGLPPRALSPATSRERSPGRPDL